MLFHTYKPRARPITPYTMNERKNSPEAGSPKRASPSSGDTMVMELKRAAPISAFFTPAFDVDAPPTSRAATENKPMLRCASYTTRVLHSGLHQVSVIINGKEFGKYDFELID